MFTPGRLSLARKRRRLTKKGLAQALGVTPHTTLRYESGDITPPDEVVAEIARILAFPAEFFSSDDVDEPQVDAASFRSLTAMSAKERDAALAAGSLAFLLSDWVEQRFDLPKVDLIDLAGEDPDVAARCLRQEWALGERPIKNMVHLLEAKGVRLFSLVENTCTVDAFSMWRADRPFVFLNMMKTPEHSRFDAGHELGHLVLHKHGGPKGRKAEDEANQFASSLLMPASDVLATIPRIHTINQVIQTKKRWAVSAMALIHRLHRGGRYVTLAISNVLHSGDRARVPQCRTVWHCEGTVCRMAKGADNSLARACDEKRNCRCASRPLAGDRKPAFWTCQHAWRGRTGKVSGRVTPHLRMNIYLDAKQKCHNQN